MGFIDRARRAWGALRATGTDLAARAFTPVSVYQTSYGMPNQEKVTESFEQYAAQGFGSNPIVFGLVGVRARLFSEARFKYRQLSDKKLFGDTSLSKLEHPWPGGTTGDLLARMEQDASLAGTAYIRDLGDRVERLRPDWVTIVSLVTSDPLGRQIRNVIGYIYDPIGDPDRGVEFYDADEVAAWTPTPDPLANWRGMSWLTPVLREINADLAMTEHRDKFFRNAATPNLILKYANHLEKHQKEAIRDAITARHAGPSNAGGTLVLDEGADPMIVGSSFTDAQFEKLQAAGENRIAVAAGVPAIVAGLKEGMDAAAWSFYAQAVRAFADLTMRPNWRGACAALAKLIPVPDGAELWFDISDIAALQAGEQESAATLSAQASTLASLVANGWDPESAKSAVSAGDITLLKHTGLVSVQLLPPGEPSAPDPNPSSPPEGGTA